MNQIETVFEILEKQVHKCLLSVAIALSEMCALCFDFAGSTYWPQLTLFFSSLSLPIIGSYGIYYL